ncbi:putative PTS system, EIIA component [Streptococcus troglodytae]|uniref:Putative PTS system, EIIA component n=1 Tax=Streptococcus troglodytae TaxID=1111760 RepID=A0A1L7LLS8_9STRE|nr:PTS sugar transporter subunit IIA [Streptococcus troglodytae]BAQ25080.1 putative PTS system, EIIA component [Streptococcus troglodytae]
METNFLELYLNQDFSSQDDVYHFLAEKLAKENHLTVSEIVTKFIKREKLGNIQIYDRIIMPHFNEQGISNKIIILRTNRVISKWSEQLKNVQLIIALIIDSDVSPQEKEYFQKFIKN